MGQWFSTTCPIWLNLNHSQPINDQNQEPDERTPLIINPPPPRPTPQLIQDTAQQIEDEAAANKIVDETVRCLVHVYSQAPFSHLTLDSQTQERSDPQTHTPDGSTTTWRAYDPPSCPPISPEIRRLRLGYDQPRCANESNQSTRIDQKRSYHSLKTMINHTHPNRSETTIPSSNTTPLTRSDSTPTPTRSSDLSSSSQDFQSHPQHLRDSTDTSDYQCDTITSFQTALEHTPSHDEPSESQPSHSQPPDFVGKLWPNFHTTLPFQDPSALERNECLTDDPQDLRALLDSGFTLKDPGPILVDL
ncbi:uncharacterized protein MELLADRAFT_70646 [Melampsora larici-populina 98AG31]|uniref:Uncharacterized protein n=1 Tax=Melampsora larici-populina (strain 98AG31 / pathotype 3-4-7) TaxID=747676 RepID=F4R500_MELLP|nr:uncharacterized protein MELLADRAFT_70646 [Melampsora larici-populina 98AG31]EGG12358.1 hypothetical protein MELLADRAFT_70646 [Melampsora larici-populina 98AG31]